MRYQWIGYNSTSGVLDCRSGDMPPYVTTTTVVTTTPSGTSSAKTTTQPGSTQTTGTNTTTSTDKDGNTVKTTVTTKFDTSLVAAGFALIGVYDDNNPMDSATQTTYDNHRAWLYQSGKFVANPNYEASEFAQAQQTQLGALANGLKSTLAGGFTAKTLVGSATKPHTYPTDAGAQANFTGAVAAFQANPNKTTVTLETLDAGWVSHTKAEFFGVYTDGDGWKESQYPQLGTLQAKVNAMKLSDYSTLADAITAVQGVTWTPATY